jgi:hypothetical protein
MAGRSGRAGVRPIHHALMGVARNLRRVRGATGEPHCYLRESSRCRFAADPANRHNQLDFRLALPLGSACPKLGDFASLGLRVWASARWCSTELSIPQYIQLLEKDPIPTLGVS